MSRYAVVAARVVIALSLLGSLVVQTVIVPLLWIDLEGEPLTIRVAVTALAVAGVGSLQVFAVCVWLLLGAVRRGTVFSRRSFRPVDVMIGSIVAAAVVVFCVAVLMAGGDTPPGVVGIVAGFSLVLVGMALVVVVMRTLLAQAIAREQEARDLRSELDEVI